MQVNVQKVWKIERPYRLYLRQSAAFWGLSEHCYLDPVHHEIHTIILGGRMTMSVEIPLLVKDDEPTSFASAYISNSPQPIRGSRKLAAGILHKSRSWRSYMALIVPPSQEAYDTRDPSPILLDLIQRMGDCVRILGRDCHIWSNRRFRLSLPTISGYSARDCGGECISLSDKGRGLIDLQDCFKCVRSRVYCEGFRHSR